MSGRKNLNLRDRKNSTIGEEEESATEDVGLGAEGGEEMDATEASSQPTASSQVASSQAGSKAKRAAKFPCGKCQEEVKTKSVCCNSCEFWYHYECAEGMTKAYFENCRMSVDTMGRSAFLCQVCKKVMNKVNKALKNLEDEMVKLSNRVVILELEKESLALKVENMELRATKVKEGLEGVEKEVASGMALAKEEVKKDVSNEMKEREERGVNIVLYGVEESKEEDPQKWRQHDKEKVEGVARQVGVELRGEVEVKFRAGKKGEANGGARPRPMIVRVSDDETRENLFRNARMLKRSDEWKAVYISPDLTWAQREEERKVEKRLKEEAEEKTEEAKKDGRTEKFIVVGQRGRRRIIRVE